MFFDKDFLARCQQSIPCLFNGRLFPVPTLAQSWCQMLTSLSFFGIAKEKILVTMMVVVILYHWYIQQKTIIHTHSAENCPNGNSSPSMTNVRGNNRKPKCTPCSQPPFFAMTQSTICKYFKPRWHIESLTPFAWVSWLTESEIFDSKSKSLPCFPLSWQTHYFWGKNEKYHKGR